MADEFWHDAHDTRAQIDPKLHVAYDEPHTVKVAASEKLAAQGGTPVRRAFLPFHQPLIESDDEHAVLETLRSGWLTTGPRTRSFEQELTAYTGRLIA